MEWRNVGGWRVMGSLAPGGPWEQAGKGLNGRGERVNKEKGPVAS
jgi:hypothetical protein